MSEYQYVAFRAIDAPVSEKNLAYMERQSSRALSRFGMKSSLAISVRFTSPTLRSRAMEITIQTRQQKVPLPPARRRSQTRKLRSPVVSLNRTVAELRGTADGAVLQNSTTPTADRPPSKRAPRVHRDRQVR